MKPNKEKGAPTKGAPEAVSIVYGFAKPSQGQIREAERLRQEFLRTGKEKHRVAYDKHVAAMLSGRPNLTREDKIKRFAWEHAEKLWSEPPPSQKQKGGAK
jgi:hypothetical protein